MIQRRDRSDGQRTRSQTWSEHYALASSRPHRLLLGALPAKEERWFLKSNNSPMIATRCALCVMPLDFPNKLHMSISCCRCTMQRHRLRAVKVPVQGSLGGDPRKKVGLLLPTSISPRL